MNKPKKFKVGDKVVYKNWSGQYLRGEIINTDETSCHVTFKHPWGEETYSYWKDQLMLENE